MFDDILKAVKEHFAANPQLTADVPADQHDALHNEVAQHVANNLSNTAPTTTAAPATNGMSGMLGKLKDEITSGNPVVTAIEGGLVGSLASKFGLGAGITGAITASLPGLLKKFTAKPTS
jgi:hypothetical protein